MRLRGCPIDTSCVIALDHLELLPQLRLLFSLVLIPKAVRTDLYRRRTTKNRVQALFTDFAFLERCDSYDQAAVDILLAERSRHGTKDRGEAEAVVQASQQNTAIIVDDRWGRELAARFDLEYHGTLWILGRFHALGLMSDAGLRGQFQRLRQLGIRLPWNLVNDTLQWIGQDSLPGERGFPGALRSRRLP